jgi:hypothetical protein
MDFDGFYKPGPGREGLFPRFSGRVFGKPPCDFETFLIY